MTFITDIDPTDPPFNGPAGEIDDQMRQFKSDVQDSFPNIDAAVTPTPAEMNFLAGVTALIQTQLDDLVTSDALKAPIDQPVFTISIAIGSSVVNETELGILQGATLSTVELNYSIGVTSAIQGQVDSKLANSGTKTVTGTTNFSNTANFNGVSNFNDEVDINAELTVNSIINQGDGVYMFHDSPNNLSGGKIRILNGGTPSGGNNGDMWLVY